MKRKTQSVARAGARLALIVAASFAMLAAWPAALYAQAVVRVPPATVVVPETRVQVAPKVIEVPQVTVQLPDYPTLGAAQRLLDSLKGFDWTTLDRAKDFDWVALDRSLWELQAQQGKIAVRPTPFVRVWEGDPSGMYESGLSALDNDQWQRAVERFDQVIKANKTHVDGAMYWKAYALDKLGQRSEALATIDGLQKAYPNSRYLDDAKALGMEVRKHAGQSIKPEDQSDEDLKLIALTSVMQADPERAIPLLEQMLKGQNSLKIKQRALFLLSTNDSPRARDVLSGIARGGANPDLQLKALRYLGMRRNANSQLLADIYKSSKDTDVKREIIRSLMMARDVDQLLNLAKTETSPELRIEAIRQLGMMKADNLLYNLYFTEKTGEIREQIFRSMLMSGDAQRAAELARQEADAKVRANAVRNLGMTDSAKTGDALVQIYRSDKDKGVKTAVITALYMQRNAKALVDLARQETDPAMKKEIVSRLSTMKAKEATDYMLELLK